MKKVLLGLIIPLISLSISTNVLASEQGGIEELKNTPATLYDVGKSKLETFVYLKNKKLKGQVIDRTKLKLSGIAITEENEELKINITAIGAGKHLTQAQCQNVLRKMKSVFNMAILPRLFWKGLSPTTYTKLESEITVQVALTNEKDNSEVLRCS